jgi:predicted DNA repair protein MutK
MAGSSLLALIDDIATILDDVALMTKVAAKKTAGVLGDDLALNAEQVSGVRAERELPVVWAVALGSLRNKVILVPLALAISALAPWAVTPLLMLGGAYLCYEGVEKLAHKFLHSPAEDAAHEEELIEALSDPDVDLAVIEKEKIKGAIRTDFILSAEIVTISLGTVAKAPFMTQVFVLSGISLIMTIGVYGLVAGIVKMDDLGLYLSKTTKTGPLAQLQRTVGKGLLMAAPALMKFLSVLGTVAMFTVGGGILTHGIETAHKWIHDFSHSTHEIPGVGHLLEGVLPTVLDGLAGVLAGIVVLLLVTGAGKIFKRSKPSAEATNKH